MAEAGRAAGLVYVCNPNNPTGTVTPDLRSFLARLPASTAVLVDEAYHHYADGDGYESVVPALVDPGSLGETGKRLKVSPPGAGSPLRKTGSGGPPSVTR